MPAEEVIEHSLLEDALKTYINKGIKEIYGLTILEFLELPFGLSKLFIKLANDEGAKKSAIASDIEKQFSQK